MPGFLCLFCHFSLLPGPVTLMFERLPTLPDSFNPGVKNVCCRVPDSLVVSQLCRYPSNGSQRA